MDYRKKEDFHVIKLPKPLINEDRGLIECCCNYEVFADESSNDTWKNDITGRKIQRFKDTDIVTFKIKKCGVSGYLTNYGTDAIFPNEPLAVGFMFDWKQYLLNYGCGMYTIEVEFTISGVTGGYTIGNFQLFNYNTQILDGTVRIRSHYSSYSLEEQFDYTGSNFVDTIRFGGMFGLMQPNSEVNNLVDKGRKVLKTSREFVKSYELKSNPLGNCFTDLILNHLLNEDDCFISDHNSMNHSYQYLDFPVSLNQLSNFDYPGSGRKIVINGNFGDRTKITKSLYNVL